MKTILSLCSALFISMIMCSVSYSQIVTPRPSPGATVKQDLGLTQVSVQYSRPGVKERTIFGDLVQYGKVWRTGANSATTIKFDSDVKIQGKDVEAGKYAILSIPGEEEWTIILSNNDKVSAPSYKQEEDALRFTVQPVKYAEKVETFTINFTDVKDNRLNVQLLWENTSVSFSVETDVNTKVLKSIETTLAGPSSRDLYVAAQYYYNNDMDINQAVEWINKSVGMDEEKPKFWVVHWQAKILGRAGMTKEAIEAAESSMKLANIAKYDEYVKKNEVLIQELENAK